MTGIFFPGKKMPVILSELSGKVDMIFFPGKRMTVIKLLGFLRKNAGHYFTG